MTVSKLEHEFVHFIPKEVEEGRLYISTDYATAVHKCCCGCGNEVVTPLAPTDWQLTFDGVSVSLYPSIGNWSFDCQSHYVIRCNTIRWAPKWTRDEVDAGRARDRFRKASFESGISNVDHDLAWAGAQPSTGDQGSRKRGRLRSLMVRRAK